MQCHQCCAACSRLIRLRRFFRLYGFIRFCQFCGRYTKGVSGAALVRSHWQSIQIRIPILEHHWGSLMINRSIFAALAIVGISLSAGCCGPCGPCGWFPGKNLGRLFHCNGCGPRAGGCNFGSCGDSCDCHGNWVGGPGTPTPLVEPTPMTPDRPAPPPEGASTRFRPRSNSIRPANYDPRTSYNSRPPRTSYRPSSYRLRPTSYSFEKSEIQPTAAPATGRYASKPCPCGRH
jgi:hypothetical protein